MRLRSFGNASAETGQEDRPGGLSYLVRSVLQLARFNSHRKPILLGRQRAGRIGRESARRIVSLVEVQHHVAIFPQIRVEEAAAAVGFFARGQVSEDERQRSEERRVGKECRSRWAPD